MGVPTISAARTKIGQNVTFGENVKIECETFECGDCCYFGDDTTITCRSFKAGDYLYFANGVEVGRGGCRGARSHVEIGSYVGVFENTVINPSEPVSIGDYVGIGADVLIWTHGAWLDPLDGFPSAFGPVEIGANVWLPARSIVLPNVKIGRDTVIAINSVVNRDLPSGCLAGGNPAKVLKEEEYPKILSFEQKKLWALGICEEWLDLIRYKLGDVDFVFEISQESGVSLFEKGKLVAVYKIFDKPYTMLCWELERQDVCEDFRDFLRRNGVKIFSGEAFKSIPSLQTSSKNFFDFQRRRDP